MTPKPGSSFGAEVFDLNYQYKTPLLNSNGNLINFGHIGGRSGGIPIKQRVTLNGVYIYFTYNGTRDGSITPAPASGSPFTVAPDPLTGQNDLYRSEGGIADGSLRVFGIVQSLTRAQFGSFGIPIRDTGMHIELLVTPTPKK